MSDSEARVYINGKHPAWHDNGVGIVQGSHYRSGFVDGAEWQASRKVEVTAPLTIEAVIDGIHEHGGLGVIISHERAEAHYCCEVGCGSGACETCPCCSAGWCVSGGDGLPDNPGDLALWLEIASDHNPVAAALSAALGGGEHE